jgi:hypothetical protein
VGLLPLKFPTTTPVTTKPRNLQVVNHDAHLLFDRVKAQKADPEVATKMLTESFLAALRRSNEKELREFARIKFESSSVVGRKPQ